jgi:hypothetical protein
MTSIYEQDLARNEANFAPISPLGFIERTAEVYPDRLAIVHGALRQNWGQTYRAGPPPGQRAAARWHRQERHRGGDAAQHAAHGGGAFRRADVRRRAQHPQYPTGPGGDCFHAGPRRGQGGDCRPRIRPDDEEGARAAPVHIVGARHRCGGRFVHRRCLAHRQHHLRSFPGRWRRRFRLEAAGRRVGRHLPELHQRHHRQPQGRGLPPSRRGDQCDLQRAGVGHAQARGLPVDAADVPLQWLVLPVDGGGPRGRQRVPSPRRGAGYLRCHPHSTASRTTAARRSCTACWSMRQRR